MKIQFSAEAFKQSWYGLLVTLVHEEAHVIFGFRDPEDPALNRTWHNPAEREGLRCAETIESSVPALGGE